MESIKYDQINTGKYQERAIIMIHGWQGNRNSFKSITKLLKLDNTMWFFPEAPFSVNGDSIKKTWTYEKSPGVWEIDKPRAMIRKFILEEVLSKFNAKDVCVMGFSQGAAVCYEMILSFEHPLGGIFPIGGFIRKYYPGQHNNVKINISPMQKDTPILIGHGKDDDIVSVEASKRAYELLKRKCNNVQLHIYNGKHKISLSYLNKVKEIILN